MLPVIIGNSMFKRAYIPSGAPSGLVSVPGEANQFFTATTNSLRASMEYTGDFPLGYNWDFFSNTSAPSHAAGAMSLLATQAFYTWVNDRGLTRILVEIEIRGEFGTSPAMNSVRFSSNFGDVWYEPNLAGTFLFETPITVFSPGGTAALVLQGYKFGGAQIGDGMRVKYAGGLP